MLGSSWVDNPPPIWVKLRAQRQCFTSKKPVAGAVAVFIHKAGRVEEETPVTAAQHTG
jgi:hypothetical protein